MREKKIFALMFVLIIIFSFNVFAYDKLIFRGGEGEITQLYDLHELESSKVKVNGNIKIDDGKCSGSLIMSAQAVDIDGKKIDLKLKMKLRDNECTLGKDGFSFVDNAEIAYKTRNNGKREIIGIDARGYYQYGRVGVEAPEKFQSEDEVTVILSYNSGGLLSIFNEDFGIEDIKI